MKSASVGVEDEVLGGAAQGAGDLEDALFAAFDLDEHPDRRLVNRDDHVAEGEFLAILLIAEPDRVAERLEAPEHRLAIADDGFDLFAQLHRRRLDRALEGQQALARLHANAQHAPALPQGVGVIVEQGVFLQAPAPQRRRPGVPHGRARVVDRVEPQLDFAFERRSHAHKRPYYSIHPGR